jgi:hypothetical protein
MQAHDLQMVEWTRIKINNASYRDSLALSVRRRIARAFDTYVHGDHTLELHNYEEPDGTVVVTVTTHPNAVRQLSRWV